MPYSEAGLKFAPTLPFHLVGGDRPNAMELTNRQGLNKRRGHCWRHDELAVGLQWSEASLARNLLYEMPADAVRPVSSKMRVRISAAVADAVGMPRRFR
jgi:hypothetical protein